MSSITQPLTVLLRREKEKQEEERNSKDKGKQPEETSAEQSTEQPVEQPAEETTAESGTDTTMTDAPLPTVEAAEDQGTEITEGDGASKKADGAEKHEEKRKRKSLEPPVVPDHNFRLVVHILAARECNGKTFRDTLSTINNLSAIPGARDVIGNELVGQAQTLSDTILGDLEELLPHIHQSKTGTDMQRLGSGRISPASSDQAKFLRILTALNYLFDRTCVDKSKGAEPESAPKEDVLKRLYESASFGLCWTKLSENAGTVIRQKENMLNVATILLPLIEASHVTCFARTLPSKINHFPAAAASYQSIVLQPMLVLAWRISSSSSLKSTARSSMSSSVRTLSS